MGGCVTGEAARERFSALADQVDAAYAEMRKLSSDEVGNEFRTELAERLETQERTNRALMYRMFGQIADPPDETAMAPALVNSLAARLRIPPREVERRMKTAARIAPRRPLTGPPLEPELPNVAAAVQAGVIGEDHLRVICRAVDALPSCVSATDRQDVEASLVREAAKSDAEIVRAAARRIDEIFNSNADYDEEDRARRRGLVLGAQGPDGMSRLAGYIDPETRAYLEALTAATPMKALVVHQPPRFDAYERLAPLSRQWRVPLARPADRSQTSSASPWGVGYAWGRCASRGPRTCRPSTLRRFPRSTSLQPQVSR
jgi:Domain of unknown function (DUF222)